MENILLFPTLVTKNKFDVFRSEKNLWYNAYLKHSNSDGKTHDFLGYETVQHEESLQFFFTDKLKPTVNEYLSTLHLDHDFFNIHVTKTFFNVTDQNGIHEHDHAENHISFVYYPHIAPGKERNLIFYHPSNVSPNEPYPQWFDHLAQGWDHINARSFSLGVEEGVLYVFPSKLAHNIEKRDCDCDNIRGFKTYDDLEKTRFCVAGDMIITKKRQGSYKRTLPPVVDWKVL